MARDFISYLQEYCFNVKIYAEYFVMFNKWELEQASRSSRSAVCTSWLGSLSKAPCPCASLLSSTQGHSSPLRLDVPNWIS